MLTNSSQSPFRTYGIRLKGDHQKNVAGIHSIGWEMKKQPSTYDWDGMNRSEVGKVIFQYTLRGSGKIEMEGDTYTLKSGDAFLVNIPSRHRYYLPAESDSWEFIFITLYGKEAINCYEAIINKSGQIIQLDSTAPPVRDIFELLKKADENELQDAYQASASAYSFLMDLMSYLSNGDKQSWPDSVQRAVLFIKQHYREPIILDDIVDVAGISKYHFTRLFQQYTNMTPMKFLSKIRIEQAMKLLEDNTLTVEEIAKEVGYANGNYFNKVFRSFLGVSPGKYRSGKTFVPFDHIVTD